MARALRRPAADRARRPPRMARRAASPTTAIHILDVHGLSIPDPVALEADLNQIAGVVTVGLFAARPADVLLVGTAQGVQSR